MTTKALETLAIPVLEEVHPHFDISEDGEALLFILRSSEFTLQWAVLDHSELRLLSIEAWNIVAFALTDNCALDLSNQLNRKCAGKFWRDDQGHVDYCLELPYTENTTPREFEHALYLALGTVSTHYQGWMRVRWAEKPKRTPRKDPSRRSKTVEALIEEALNQD
jgi:hypothetical protein